MTKIISGKFHANPIVVFAVIWGSTGVCIAQSHSKTANLEIIIEGDPVILGQQYSGPDSSSVPLKDIFVYAPPTEQLGKAGWFSGEKRLRGVHWLRNSKYGEVGPPTDFMFTIRDNQFQPQLSVMHIRDKVFFKGGEYDDLWLDVVANEMRGGALRANESGFWLLSRGELLPIRIRDSAEQYKPAWALVLDHNLARITNNDGIVFFDDLPVGIEVPFQVSYSLLSGHKLKLSSDTLVLRGSRFDFRSEDGKPQKHKIAVQVVSPD